MRFLRDKDYQVQIRQEVLRVTHQSKDFTLHDAEALAQSQIEGMLRSRYDIAVIFAPLVPYHVASSYVQDQRIMVTAEDFTAVTQYEVNDLVKYNELVYLCTAQSTANLPTDTDYFTPFDDDQALYSIAVENATASQTPKSSTDYLAGDTRHRYLVSLFVDVTLYHLHSNITPKNVPDVRSERYKAALKALEQAEKGRRNYGLPILEGKQSNKYRMSKTTRRTRRW